MNAKKIQNQWSKIDKTKFIPGIADTEIATLFVDDKEGIIQFLTQMLENQHARADYKEVLELCLIFLGESPGEKIVFRQPGAMHHARWMSKVLYSLKIFFSKSFKLAHSEEKALSKITVFIVKIYVRVWFLAPISVDKSIDQDLSDSSLHKFVNHLWYLNEENIGFAFFDESVLEATKEKMQAAMLSECND